MVAHVHCRQKPTLVNLGISKKKCNTQSRDSPVLGHESYDGLSRSRCHQVQRDEYKAEECPKQKANRQRHLLRRGAPQIGSRIAQPEHLFVVATGCLHARKPVHAARIVLGLVLVRTILADHAASPVVEMRALLEDAQFRELLALAMALAKELFHVDRRIAALLYADDSLAVLAVTISTVLFRRIYALLDPRHAIAAARLDLPDVADDDGARAVKVFSARPPRHRAHEVLELGAVPLNNGGPAEEAEDARGGAETHEHEAQTAILVAVRDGLAAGAHAVNVRAAVRGENGKVRVGEALGRDVDV